MATANGLTWSVVIPVKVLARAKSRLVGLATADREALALAMAADTIAAAMSCPPVGSVIVISDDPAVRRAAGSLGADLMSDRPGAGLNQVLTLGAEFAARRWPERGVAALTGDLPALTPAELFTALTAAATQAQSFVADAAGSGTTLYTASPGYAFQPRFGSQSRARHGAAGAVEIDLAGLGGLRRDVDTLTDLRSAARIGLGRRSAAVNAALAAR